MYTSYKFNWITRDDKGYIIKASVRFLEGEYKDVQFQDFRGATTTKNMYVPTAVLETTQLKGWKGTPSKDIYGTSTVEYDTNDFGKIKTDDEFRAFVNSELIKDTKRTPVPAQAETDVEKLKLMEIK
jgi:hypothetical protein